MASLGFFHNVYDNLVATEFAIKSVREHYPDAFYMLIGDGGVDHYELAKKYNCHYYHNANNLGYGEFNKEQVSEALKRVLMACIKTDTTHLMMMEDDVVILDKVELQDDWYCIGQPIGFHNKIHPHVLEIAKNFSGVTPQTDYYCFGGGSILHVETFLQNFGNVFAFFQNNFELVHAAYPQMGWIDCFLTFFFYLSGKPINLHSKLYTVAPWPVTVNNFNLDTVRGEYQIVDRFKNFYK